LPSRRRRPKRSDFDFGADDLVREFLLSEILPEVRQRCNITDDLEDHAICGISSGGICAFTVAWDIMRWFLFVVARLCEMIRACLPTNRGRFCGSDVSKCD